MVDGSRCQDDNDDRVHSLIDVTNLTAVSNVNSGDKLEEREEPKGAVGGVGISDGGNSLKLIYYYIIILKIIII